MARQSLLNVNRDWTVLIMRGIILFWALWFSLVTITDSINLLQHFGLVPIGFTYTSGNYDLVYKSISNIGLHYIILSIILFCLIVIWAFIIAVSFWITFFSMNDRARFYKLAYFSFMISLLMTAFFIIADEFFIQYKYEEYHVTRITLQLVSFLTFFLIHQTHK